MIIRAPVGTYYFTYAYAGNNNIKSEEKSNYLQSNVSQIILLSSPPPEKIKIGQSFDEIILKIVDSVGNDIPGIFNFLL